ncbi:MAG: hypothetical protein SFW67_20105 [Myxococcaceae bacterium]|nr:hypothetical protein [Myxococcaceae bacterium]
MRAIVALCGVSVLAACGGPRVDPPPTGGAAGGGGAEMTAGGGASQATPPSIMAQPQAVSVEETASATFSVTASGENLTYQWLRDGAPIADATAATYSIPMVSSFDDGARFSVRVQNGGGAVTSSDARLTVTLKGIAVSADGGTVSSADGLITLTLPPGAITADGTIRFRPVEPPAVPADAGFEDFAEGFPRRSWQLELTGAQFAAGPGFGVTIANPDPVRTQTTFEPSETAVVRLCPDQTALALGGNGGLCGAVVSSVPCDTDTPETTISLRRYVPIRPVAGSARQTVGREGNDTIRRTLGGRRWSAVVWDRSNVDPKEANLSLFRTNGQVYFTIPLQPDEDPIAYDGLGTLVVRMGNREGVTTQRCALTIRTLALTYRISSTSLDWQTVTQLRRDYQRTPTCLAPSSGTMTRNAFYGVNFNRFVHLEYGKTDREWTLPPEISANYPRLVAQAGPQSPVWLMGMSTVGCGNPCAYVASADITARQPVFGPAVRLGTGQGVRTSPGGYRLGLVTASDAASTVWMVFGATERTTASPAFAGRLQVVGLNPMTNLVMRGAFLPGSDGLEATGIDVDTRGRIVVVTNFGAYSDGAQSEQGLYAYRIDPETLVTTTHRLRDMSAAPGSAYGAGLNRGGGWTAVDDSVVSVSIDVGMTGIPNAGCSTSSTGCGDVLILRSAL